MSRKLQALFFLLFSLPLAAQQNEVESQAPLKIESDRTDIRVDESFRLFIHSAGDSHASPDTSALSKDFHVFGTGFQSQTSIVNGRRSQDSKWVITLQALEVGEFEIPSMQVGARKTESLSVTILPAQVFDPASGEGGNPVVVELTAESTTPYVQSQLLVTAKVWMDDSIRGGSLTDPILEGAMLERFGEDKNYNATRNGQSYQVVERRYALFPQTSGPVTIPPVIFDGTRSDPNPATRGGRRDSIFSSSPFGGLIARGTPFRAQSQPLDIQVRAKPGEASAEWWLPAHKVELLEQWQPEIPTLHVGEPVTRNLILRATGLADAQMPTLTMPTLAGCKIYPGTLRTDTATVNEKIVSIAVQPIVIVPTQAGELTLPAIEIQWWDLAADVMRTARLEARTLQVLPGVESEELAAPLQTENEAAGASEGGEPQAPSAQEDPGDDKRAWAWWMGGSGAFLGGLWILLRHRRVSQQKKVQPADGRGIRVRQKTAELALHSACQNNDSMAAHAAILALAQVLWPWKATRNCSSFARQYHSLELKMELSHLDAFRFGKPGVDGPEVQVQHQAEWSGESLWRAYCSVQTGRTEKKVESPLPPLYPQKN